MKNGIRNEFKLIIRGLKVIQSMMPTYILFAVLTALVSSISPYTNLYFSAKIIDEIMGNKDIKSIFINVVGLIFIDFFTRLLFQVFFAKVRVNELIFSDWEESYLNKKSFNLSYSYMENSEIRALRQRISDNRKIGGLNVLLQKIIWLFKSILSLVIAVIMLPGMFVNSTEGKIDSSLAFINTPFCAVIFLIIVIVSLVWVTAHNNKFLKKQYDNSNELSKSQKLSHFYLDEYFDDAKSGKDVRLYQQENLILSSLKLAFDSYLKEYKKVSSSAWQIKGGEDITAALLNGLVYLYVGLKTLSGTLSVGSLVKYSGVIRNIMYSVLSLVSIVGVLKSNNKYLRDFFEFLDLPENNSEQNLTSNNKKNSFAKVDFEISNMSFKYPESDFYTLKNIDLNIKHGEKIAIVGKNGSGKTTFVKLLCGLYNPTKGSIKYNGIEKSENSQIYGLFSIVFQDFKVFSFSLGQNISANNTYDPQKACEAMKLAGLENRFKSFDFGFDTAMYKDFDESGVEISGGEAQKIAIARAFYKDAPVLIFDEPTAALDPMAEFEIYNKLSEISNEKTTIFISHRLSSCCFCDRIIVFDDGVIVQDGNHNELLKDVGGLYYELWNAQAQYYKETGVNL